MAYGATSALRSKCGTEIASGTERLCSPTPALRSPFVLKRSMVLHLRLYQESCPPPLRRTGRRRSR
eukprot:2099464-Rhodomonas_salina.1